MLMSTAAWHAEMCAGAWDGGIASRSSRRATLKRDAQITKCDVLASAEKQNAWFRGAQAESDCRDKDARVKDLKAKVEAVELERENAEKKEMAAMDALNAAQARLSCSHARSGMHESSTGFRFGGLVPHHLTQGVSSYMHTSRRSVLLL
jgi:hypothetical protein